MNTMLAACFGGLAAMIINWKHGHLRLPEPEYILNGVLGGLVGITAGCDAVSTLGAVFIGITSGAISYFGCLFIERKLKLDDVVGAVAVHGFCGAWGTVVFVLFTDNLNSMKQIGVQALGVTACFVWTFSMAWFLLTFIKKYWGLRISEKMELDGLNVSEHGVKSTLIDLAQSMNEIKEGKAIELCKDLEFQKGTEMGDLAEGYNAMLKTIKQALNESVIQKDIAEAAKMKAEITMEKIDISRKKMEQALKEAEDSKTKTTEALTKAEAEALKNEENMKNIEEEKLKTQSLLEEISQRERSTQQEMNFLENKTEDAFQIAESLIKTIELISSEGKRVSSDIKLMADRSEYLTSTLKGISDISETTRFLSFNASIEASRVGELGQGFSVIANEIRDLARESGGFTEKINSSLKEFELQFISLTERFASQDEYTNIIREQIEKLKSVFEEISNLNIKKTEVLKKIA